MPSDAQDESRKFDGLLIHLAAPLGHPDPSAQQERFERVKRAYDFMEDMRKARAEHRLDRRMRVYLAPKVLIVDEFGICPYDRESAIAFFSLLSARYERGSIILMSNKGFADWGELLGDTVIVTAILVRLLHHSHVINIQGESHRLKDKRQSALFTSSGF